jgi:glutamate/tyrosine decarboxylase-like PLP-dependent enzyme
MLAEMYSNMFNCQGFDWVCNPAASELEGIVMNWLGELIGLDESFLSINGGLGCGSIQATASEGNLVTMVAARDRVLKKLNSNDINGNEGIDCSDLVVYASDQVILQIIYFNIFIN